MRKACCLLLVFVTAVLYGQTKKEITLEDIFKNQTFRQDAVTGFRSMKDGRYYVEINDKGDLQKIRFKDGGVEEVITNMKKLVFGSDSLKIDDYAFNADETKLMLFTESESIYRHSALHQVYVLDIASGEIQQVDKEKVLHATFSPNSKDVAYIRNNNIYVLNLESNKLSAVTSDGNYNIINGNCDWVYEEEFGFTKAFVWSEDGSFLSYYRFDQTQVPEYNFAQYDKLYPTDYRYKYPKAGEKNSVVEIHSYYLKSGKTVTHDIGTNTDIYIPRIKINSAKNTLIIYRLNRLQNHLELFEADATGGTRVIYSEKNERYVSVDDGIHFLEKENAFIYTSERDGYKHLYLHDIESNTSAQLTKGKWEVVSFAGVDEARNLIYFTSTMASPLDRNLFSIKLNGEGLTCITPAKGWNDCYLSNDFSFFMKKYSFANQPPVFSICDRNGKEVRLLKQNESLQKTMKAYDLAKQEFIEIPTSNGVKLNGWILKPTSFDPNKKYPVLMYQYSGPGSQEVKNQFGGRDFWWYQLLAQKGYITVCVDGTGTGSRGEEFKKKTYLQLGKYESDDQIAAANYLKTLPFIDAQRIGIWGWSYGGFMSATCLFKAPEVFKMAIAVAPVTNWRYYDNIYTERYMRTPQENAAGYDNNSPINMVKNLKGKFLLVHGTSDDNVHVQNSLMMIDELVKNNKDFDSEMYPNKNHGISGGSTRLQLYRKMTNFILDNL